MKIHIPSQLQSYTEGKSEIDLFGKTVGEVLEVLERSYPGSRFRIVSEQGTIREHVRIFINKDLVGDLSTPVHTDDELHIICALSGG